MKKFFFEIAVIAFVLLFVSGSTLRASAHGEEPRLEIGQDRLNPGSVLDLRGIDFAPEEEVVLDLIGQGVQVSFGSVLTDVEGGFLLTLELPADIAEGLYVMRATSSDHVVESSQLTVWGSMDLGGGEQREEEDSLLGPMPTFPPNASTAVPQPAAPVEKPSPSSAALPLGWILGGIGIAAVLLVFFKRKR